MIVRSLLLACILACAAWAQVSDYDLYLGFREWVQSLPADQRGNRDQLIRRYSVKLAGEGLGVAEIDRRASLLRDQADKFEAEYWNRRLTADKPAFNTEPNAFLVATVKQRKPGAALDVGMGEGRNAIYLARQGWKVTGIDFADRAVAFARERASAAGLQLETSVTAAKDYDFGRNRWDLVLFSYAGWEGVEEERVVKSLKPGGIIVVEGLLDWFGKGGLPKRFRTLRVLHYEEVEAISDFHNRRKTEIVRFAAEKPPALTISVLEDRLAVCRLAPGASLPDWALRSPGFTSFTRTSDELSVIARDGAAPRKPSVKAAGAISNWKDRSISR